MIIGLISDTHLQNQPLPSAVIDTFQGVSLILHAGDLVSPPTLLKLEEIAPVVAVQGNMDSLELRTSLPRKSVIEVKGHRIGLIHGNFVPNASQVLSGSVDTEAMHDYLLTEFGDDKIDCLVYGHTHLPIVDHQAGICLVNPGSATWSRNGPCTVGLLTLLTDRISAEIIEMG